MSCLFTRERHLKRVALYIALLSCAECGAVWISFGGPHTLPPGPCFTRFWSVNSDVVPPAVFSVMPPYSNRLRVVLPCLLYTVIQIVQAGWGTHSSLCTIGTGFRSPGLKRPGRDAGDWPPVTVLGMSGAIPLPTLLCLHGMDMEHFTVKCRVGCIKGRLIR